MNTPHLIPALVLAVVPALAAADEPAQGLMLTPSQLQWKPNPRCQFSPQWSHFVFGVKEPLNFRRNGASVFSA